MRVLILESQVDRAQLIKSLIEPYHYKINICDNTEEIDVQLKDPTLGLVVIGPTVNSIKGLELLSSIKSQPRMENIPIIYISNNQSIEARRQLNKYKNTEFIMEPFKIKNFKHLVEKWLNFRSLYLN